MLLIVVLVTCLCNRGNLSLSLLPTSDLRISFIGDDGSTDRLATLCTVLDCSTVGIEGISADQSGRSFLIKIPDGQIFYFWCSEKSKLLGDEMLRKVNFLPILQSHHILIILYRMIVVNVFFLQLM